MPNFYGIEYHDICYDYGNYEPKYHIIGLSIITNRDFHNMLYTAMNLFMQDPGSTCVFDSPNDYVNLRSTRTDGIYEITIIDIIPLINKSAVQAMINEEMLRLSE